MTMNYPQQMDNIIVHIGQMTKLYHDCAKSHGMSYNTMMVLGALHHYKKCTQKQISEEWGLPKQSVNTIIKKLQAEQYVELLEGRNKKEKLLIFTDKGNAYADKVLQPIMDMEERALQRMGEEDSRQFEQIMARFTTFLEEEMFTK